MEGRTTVYCLSSLNLLLTVVEMIRMLIKNKNRKEKGKIRSVYVNHGRFDMRT